MDSLALIKITKSPYLYAHLLIYQHCLALIKITKSPYLSVFVFCYIHSLALIKITKSPYLGFSYIVPYNRFSINQNHQESVS